MHEDSPNQAIQFSLREFLYAISLSSFIVVGFVQYGLLVASPIAIVFGAILITRGNRTKKAWLLRAGSMLSILSISVFTVRMIGWFFFDIGPIYSVDEYPYVFTRMVEIADTDISDAKVSGLGSFIDSEYVWRLTLSPEQFKQVVAEYGLVTLSADQVPSAFWHAFPNSWRPSKNADGLYFATSGFPTSSKSPDLDHCCTMYDTKSQRLYVWNKVCW